ncbi:CBS domain-containing protein [Psychrilyobacter atlanticus]|uniref:CBS domain-containing protein n=1 Tax=Psychrilyobacter atlanticus TaxID=271091 RepID=UPI000400A592|nr:CBS domain-containing protein [Psychrilyobacter atlanticus]
MEIITCHIYADLDALSSMVLIKKLYPNGILVFPGHIGKSVKAFVNLYQNFLQVKKIKDIQMDKVSKLIVVDTSKKNRIGLFEQLLDRDDVEVVIYDHHKISENDIKNRRIIRKNYGSNTTNILEVLLENDPDIKFDQIEATLGLMGIYEDTGNFSFDSTTPKDLEMASYLLQKNGDLSKVNEYVQKGLEKEQLEIFIELIENSEFIDIDGEVAQLTYYKSDDFIFGMDELINKIQYLGKSSLCVILCGNDKRISIVGRSSNKINVAEILKDYKVGGHEYAVSGVIRDQNMKKLYGDIKKRIESVIKPSKKSIDIMNTPVKTILRDTKIKLAYKVMYRMGYGGLPIVEDGKIVGIITRNSVDKALNHGFSNAPVSAYMTSEVVTADIHLSVEELKALVVEKGIGRVPIVDDKGKILGIVTRTDILKSIYSKNPVRKAKKLKFESEIKNNIEGVVPAKLLKLLKIIEAVSKKRNEKVFLVGGIVRDLILGINNKDIDIVVEGDGIKFALELKDMLGAKKVRIHEKFKTAVVVVHDDLKLDIASSRLEYYEYPTSLPVVEYGNIRDDMYRRDFSINAMALEIDSYNFGKLIDFYGGYDDLANKKIRILHNLSFVEDPTRIIRAFRFAARYGFELEKDTEIFLKNAISDGFLKKISWPRVKQELEILFSDKNLTRGMEFLNKYNVFVEINPNIKYDLEMKKNIEKLESLEGLLNFVNIKKWLLVFLIILENLEKKELDLVFKKFNFSNKFIEKYDYGILIREKILEQLESADKNSDIYNALKNISMEIITLIYIQNRKEKIKIKIENYIYSLSKMKPLIRGEDLVKNGELPGREFKDKLNAYFMKQMDMEEPTKEKILKM